MLRLAQPQHQELLLDVVVLALGEEVVPQAAGRLGRLLRITIAPGERNADIVSSSNTRRGRNVSRRIIA